MKKLRNVIVLYASNCGYRISPKQLNLCNVSHYDDKEYESIHVTSKGLYKETDNSVRKFTSVASTSSNKKELFRNFFNVDYLLKRFKQQNLDPRTVNNQTTTLKSSFEKSKPHEATTQEKEDAKKLSDDIEADKAKLKNLSSTLKVLEIKRLQEASAFRKEEKKKNGWNTVLCRELKRVRTEFNSTYKEIVEIEATIRQNSTQLYELNKLVYNKRDDTMNISSDLEDVVSKLHLKDALESNRLAINGIDPGIHSTALRKQVKSKTVVNFVENWGGDATKIKGIIRSSLKPVTSRLKAVDEYGSTIHCNSCFKKMRLQCHRRDNMFKRIKGAVACYNTKCPARLQRHTTVNGDANGAKNIGLIGFSKLVSSDGTV
ncbi:hypothetical protein INT47_000549 [Mucor saturninus]|uniref:Uncharacterized protein n=1 Tax=Mucor saturninus TaxID=64648 RepID=A0A8H7VDK7_9FUNG|nr:hypothetical protein INT47_000549 [Mucor saturninus]